MSLLPIFTFAAILAASPASVAGTDSLLPPITAAEQRSVERGEATMLLLVLQAYHTHSPLYLDAIQTDEFSDVIKKHGLPLRTLHVGEWTSPEGVWVSRVFGHTKWPRLIVIRGRTHVQIQPYTPARLDEVLSKPPADDSLQIEVSPEPTDNVTPPKE